MPPAYEEGEGDPVAHALGKAESVLEAAGDQPVLGCDTEVVCDGRVYGKPDERRRRPRRCSRASRARRTRSSPAWR